MGVIIITFRLYSLPWPRAWVQVLMSLMRSRYGGKILWCFWPRHRKYWNETNKNCFDCYCFHSLENVISVVLLTAVIPIVLLVCQPSARGKLSHLSRLLELHRRRSSRSTTKPIIWRITCWYQPPNEWGRIIQHDVIKNSGVRDTRN